MWLLCIFFFFQAEDGIRDVAVTGVQTCALPIYLVDPVDELRLERRAQVEEILLKLRKFSFGIIARMFDDAFAHFKREIETGKIQVALLEVLDNAKRVQIVKIGRASCRERV